MDLSIEAIENDLIQAESRAGQPVAAVYLTRATIRATLMAAQFVEPDPEPEASAPLPRTALVVPEITIEADGDEMDEDFFAEARKGHKK